MAAQLHLFRRCISNRLQKVCPPGRADNISEKNVHIEQTLRDQSSLLRRVLEFDDIGNTPMT